MHLIDLIPDAEVLLALESDELGLAILQSLKGAFPSGYVILTSFLRNVVPQYSTRTREVDLAIREAWAWLEGAALLIESPEYASPNSMRILSRSVGKLLQSKDVLRFRTARRLPKESLHSDIREDVWSFFHRGKYDTAVFEAMKAVEVAVRRAAGLTYRDIGTALMRKAFDPDH